MITSVWLALVLTVVVVTLLSVGNLIFKSRKREYHLYKANLVRPNRRFQLVIHNYNIIENAVWISFWSSHFRKFPFGCICASFSP